MKLSIRMGNGSSGTSLLDIQTDHGDKPPVKAVYQFTELGKITIPILLAVKDFGNQLVKAKGELSSAFQIAEASKTN